MILLQCLMRHGLHSRSNFEPLEPAYIKEVLKKAKPILDEEFIWIAYFEG
ncbi:MAG: hypothetical protein MZV63_67305 [Marinilabiliales bacterium]|nr:hypothetical protein [Marinilabiliales bacterium]